MHLTEPKIDFIPIFSNVIAGTKLKLVIFVQNNRTIALRIHFMFYSTSFEVAIVVLQTNMFLNTEPSVNDRNHLKWLNLLFVILFCVVSFQNSYLELNLFEIKSNDLGWF